MTRDMQRRAAIHIAQHLWCNDAMDVFLLYLLPSTNGTPEEEADLKAFLSQVPRVRVQRQDSTLDQLVSVRNECVRLGLTGVAEEITNRWMKERN